MSSATQTPAKPSPEQAVTAAVEKTPGGTTEGIAQAAGIGRSTAGKVLARLADAGEVTRHHGARNRGKRLPDRWTLAGVDMPPAYAADVLADAASGKPAGPAGESNATSEPPSAKASQDAAPASATSAGKLKPGGLEPLVLAYLQENADSGPHGPTAIAKALDRSSGAVGNCLVRLTDAKKVKLVTEKPRRYSLAG